MVKEKRILFWVKDLKAIRLRCGGCQGEMYVDVTRYKKEHPGVPEVCPFCGHHWVDPVVQDPLERRLVGAIAAVRTYWDRKERGVEVFFEMDDQ